MYNPYQGQQPGYQPNNNGYYQQAQQAPPQQQQQQPQFQQQQQQSGFQQQQQQQPNFSTNMAGYGQTQQLQPPSNQYYQQPQQSQGYQTATAPSLQEFQPQPQQQASQPLQQQSTGYYSSMPTVQALQPQTPQASAQTPQLQVQSTGYFQNQQAQPQLQTQLNAQHTNQNLQPPQPLLPQQTGFYVQQSQIPLEPLKPTATGFVNSFANNGLDNDIKIPAMRLSFITAGDQAKFETLFRSVVKNGSNTITGSDCRAILLKSGLQPSQLAKIWALCDTSKAGELLFPEFALAMHLINNVLQGDSIPYELETKTKNEVNSFIDAINLSVASKDSAPKNTPFDQMITAGITTLQPQPTGLMPSTSFGMPAQITGGGLMTQMTGGQMMPQTSFGMPAQVTGGLMNQMTGGQMMPQTSFGNLQTQATGGGLIHSQSTGGLTSMVPNQTGTMIQNQTGNMMPQLSFGQQSMPQQPLQAQATGYLPPSNFNPTMPLVAQKTGFGNNEIYSQANFVNKMTTIDADHADNDVITADEKSLFYKIFETYDSNKKGLLDSATAVEVFRKSGLNRSDLEHIWNLCDIDNTGQLNKQEFALGMHLVYRKLNGNPLPNRLPPGLVPSSNKILDSVKSQLKNATSTNNAAPRTDALNFKNNDDEDSLPTFRNRRKVFTSSIDNSEKTTAPAVSMASESAESKYPEVSDIAIEQPKPQEVQKSAVVQTAAPAQKAEPATTLADELKLIDSLQSEFKNLPIPEPNSLLSSDLKDRFSMVISNVPTLFAEIAEIEKEITDSRIRLFKLKNPASVDGTGANGEITDSDRRKAKSRALLRSRMAALTGKHDSSPDVEDESARFAEEVSKIKKESAENQEVIKDVRSSLADISASLKSFFVGKNLDNENSSFEKWELGVDLEPQLLQFIRQLNSSHNSISSTSANNTPSQSKQPEDRASMLKEQAQKRMKERLAKFGLDRSSRSRSNTGESNPATTPFVVESTPDARNTISASPTPTQPNPSTTTGKPVEANDSDSEDEEERKLREELQKLKLKKKADKERRLAELRKQLAAAQAEGDSDSEEETERNRITSAYVSAQAPQQAPKQVNQSVVPPEPIIDKAPQATVAPTNSSIPVTATPYGMNVSRSSTSSLQTSSFDAKAAEQQRRIQRGLESDNEDDDWSDAEEVSKKIENNLNVDVSTSQNNSNYAHAQATAALDESAPIPVAPPIPPMNNTVPVAPPIPSMNNTQEPVLIAPPIPSMSNSSTPVPVAPPLPNANAATPVPIASPPVPIAPPIPSIGNANSNTNTNPSFIPPPPSLPVSNNNSLVVETTSQDNDDVLSIPDSVASDEEENNELPPSGIPPPPPLP